MLRHARVAPPEKKCAFVLTRDGRPVKVQRSIFSECFYTMAMNELWRVTAEARYQVRGRKAAWGGSVPSPAPRVRAAARVLSAGRVCHRRQPILWAPARSLWACGYSCPRSHSPTGTLDTEVVPNQSAGHPA